jgi:hypothetical protein
MVFLRIPDKRSRRSYENLKVISSSQLKRSEPIAHVVTPSDSNKHASATPANPISRQDAKQCVVKDESGAQMARGLAFETFLEEQSNGSLEDSRQMRSIFFEKNLQVRQDLLKHCHCGGPLPRFPRLA